LAETLGVHSDYLVDVPLMMSRERHIRRIANYCDSFQELQTLSRGDKRIVKDVD